jgi:hypothetical protein
MDARLDATARAKVDVLTTRLHQPRAAVLCHIMYWGLSREPTGSLDQGEPTARCAICISMSHANSVSM